MKIQSAEEHTIHFVTTDNPYEVTYIRISSVSWLQGTTAGYTAVHSPHQLEEEFQKHIKEPKKPKPALSDIIMEGWKNHERQMQNIHNMARKNFERTVSDTPETDSILTGKSPAEPTPSTDTQHPSVGDYVLATKYTDGDPMDPWFIGFYSGPTTHTPPKYTITDVKGTPFCPYSFRKIKKITQKQGEWMLKNRELIQHSGMPVWHFTQLPEESLQ